MVVIFNCKKWGLFCLYFGIIFCTVIWANVLLAGPLPQQTRYEYKTPEKLNDGWDVASLQETGVNQEKITELIDRILNNTFENIFSVLLVKDGKLILEEYFNGYHRDKRHEIHSVTKSIASILTGIALDRGFIESVGDKIYANLRTHKSEPRWDEREKAVTLKHLLTMTSGYDCDDQLTRGGCQKNTERSNDWFKEALNFPMKYPPGQHWAYNSSSLMLIEKIISEKSGMSTKDFAKNYLFQPLGIRDDVDFKWGVAKPRESVVFYGGASMKPRAMAKFGYMVLNSGHWKSNQIVSQTWISESTGAHATTNRNFKYGYLWWRGAAVVNNQKIKAFWAAGNGGQRIFLLPDLNLVAVFTGGNFGKPIAIQTHGMMTTYIIPAILPPALPRQSLSLDAIIAQKYSGEYIFKKNTTLFEQKLQIERQGNTLWLKPSGWSKLEIFPEKEHQFYGTSKQLGDILVRFTLNDDGNVTYMTVDFAFTSWLCDKF